MTRCRPAVPLLFAAASLVAAGACSPAVIQGAAPAQEQAPGDALPTPAPAPASPAATASDHGLERARAAAADFSAQLRGKLQAAMQRGGPVAAVDVCQGEAPGIAKAVMAAHGVRLGRVALPGRNRNPAQAAGDWQRATLAAFQRAVDGGAPAAAQVAVVRDALPDGVALRMMRGIATEPGCLACHGRAVAEPVRDAILARYPDDRATGFDVGDLRGALWVEVAAIAPAAGGAP